MNKEKTPILIAIVLLGLAAVAYFIGKAYWLSLGTLVLMLVVIFHYEQDE